MPARARGPEPRASPSSTVSAWSSRVWPSSTATAPVCWASRPSAVYRALRAAASGHRPRGGHRHPDRPHRIEPEGEQIRLNPGRLGRRAVLQAVVNGHAAATQPQPGRLMGQGGGQGQRIRAARAGGQDQVPGLQVAEAAPDAGPRLGYRGMRAHGRSAARGQRASAAHPVQPQFRVHELVLGRQGLR